MPTDSTGVPVRRLDERYRIEAELGQGGMARVYRVFDERTGRRCALKQLLVTNERSATLQAMFEHEYHTLVQLAHPHIVSVFDYGLDGRDPYYTMELLEGVDAREASKAGLNVSQVCLLLRDCASALSLVHSRRMVHRDVSPRNLWCTPQGRGKLIDFGTLVAMGRQSRIAGTPPYVAPEALYNQPLDARCDLYALGALAYALLTQRNAYPSRTLNALPEYWRHKPTRPDAIRPELPRVLSDLVMALLSLDARGRPASAAEVYERLSAIADLPREDERGLAQAFLTSPTLVGRAKVISDIEHRLERSMAGRGSSVAIVARSGLGRSRVLANVVLQAKLRGAATISLDASAVGSDTLALARALAERLLETLPMLAAASVDLAPVLAQLSPQLQRALGEPEFTPLREPQRTSALSSAVVALVEAATRAQRLVITVDDVHRADGASLGVLGRLSQLARAGPLLLVTTCEAGLLTQAPPALKQLLNTRHRLELAPLSTADTHQLFESLFGAVPGLEAAASFVREVTEGSPQACMQYAQYLVDQGVVRFERGQWLLPASLRDRGLPPTLGAMLELRASQLSQDARSLALGLALAQDEGRASWQPELHVHIDDFAKLLEHGDSARAFAALDELLRAGIFEQRDQYYVLAQRAMVDTLLRSASEVSRKLAHKRLAEIFTQPGYPSSWLAIRQLQCAGEHERARAAIVQYAKQTSPDWAGMRMSLHAQCAKEAVDHWQAHGGTAQEGIVLRRVLFLAATVYDWQLARFGDAQLRQLSTDCGLSHWDDTEPAQPVLQRIGECLQRAQQTYDDTPEAQRGISPLEALRELAASSIMLSKAYVSSYDIAASRAVVDLLEKLRPLAPVFALIADQCRAGLDRTLGREFGDALLHTAQRLLQTSDGPERLRAAGAALHLHEQALEDARLGRARAFELVDRLAAVGPGPESFLCMHGLWLSHAFAGHAIQAKQFYRRIAVINEDDVWRRRAHVYFEAELHALRGDLSGLGRARDMLEELARTFEGFRPWVAYARAAMHRLRGGLTAAKSELDAALAVARAGEHRAWLLAAPARAEVLIALGDIDAAVAAAQAMLARVDTDALHRSLAVAAQRVLALAHSRAGQHAQARSAAQQALALANELAYGGLPLAALYESQARIALAARDPEQAVAALKQLWTLIAQADAPALIHAYETLREESTLLSASDLHELSLSMGNATTADPSTTYTEVQTLLTAVPKRNDRAARSLKLLLDDSGATAGHLLLLDARGLYPAASSQPNAPASPALVKEAQRYVNDLFDDPKTLTQTASEGALTDVLSDGRCRAAPIPLLVRRSALGSSVIGVALLVVHDTSVRAPRTELVRAISRSLLASGDSAALELPD